MASYCGRGLLVPGQGWETGMWPSAGDCSWGRGTASALSGLPSPVFMLAQESSLPALSLSVSLSASLTQCRPSAAPALWNASVCSCFPPLCDGSLRSDCLFCTQNHAPDEEELWMELDNGSRYRPAERHCPLGGRNAFNQEKLGW
ncbi:hypothetical protein SRHO_G00003480 [Serrasalmus rhombeus]